MSTTSCHICYEESDVWVMPPCNHDGICWKCSLKLVKNGIFSCPFCKNKSTTQSKMLFVTTELMNTSNYESVFANGPYRSTVTPLVTQKNPFNFYACEKVAQYIEGETSLHCPQCGKIF